MLCYCGGCNCTTGNNDNLCGLNTVVFLFVYKPASFFVKDLAKEYPLGSPEITYSLGESSGGRHMARADMLVVLFRSVNCRFLVSLQISKTER